MIRGVPCTSTQAVLLKRTSPRHLVLQSNPLRSARLQFTYFKPDLLSPAFRLELKPESEKLILACCVQR